jgi:sterol desaturase/sphingolipid hydroxylase (fatty acid hydroxylase superfamily)
MPFDAAWFQHIFHRAWAYFVDGHLLGLPALVFGLVLALLAGEAIFREWNKTTAYRIFVRRSTSAKIDVIYYFMQFTGIVTLIEIVLSLGIALAGSRMANATSDYLNWARISLPGDGVFELLFSFTIYWIVSGFFGYWMHRLYHLPLFWHVHRFHHAAPELNFVTAHRVHPLESVSRVFNFLSPMIFFKVPDSLLVVGAVAGNFINFCQHSELPWHWGWVGRWIFGSPRVHQLHHSTDEEHRDTNFGNCPLWDHIFGTWYDGTKEPTAYGIGDPGYDQQPLRQFARDTWAFYKAFGLLICYPVRKAMALWNGGARTAESSGTSPL